MLEDSNGKSEQTPDSSGGNPMESVRQVLERFDSGEMDRRELLAFSGGLSALLATFGRAVADLSYRIFAGAERGSLDAAHSVTSQSPADAVKSTRRELFFRRVPDGAGMDVKRRPPEKSSVMPAGRQARREDAARDSVKAVERSGLIKENLPVVEDGSNLEGVLDIGGRSREVPDILSKIEKAKLYFRDIRISRSERVLMFYDVRSGGLFYTLETDPRVSRIGRNNGVNTEFVFDNDVEHYALVALQMPSGRVYVPHSRSIDTPTVRAEGARYIASVIGKAKRELSERDVKSKVYGEKLVADIFPQDLVAQLMMIEHVDHTAFELALSRGDATLINLFNEVLVIAGANLERAYSAAGSSAGAFGFAQFIEETYRMIVGKYPQAGLISDFKQGMLHHVNAVKAMFCLMDNDLGRCTVGDLRQWLIKSENVATLGDWLAAAYNGGGGLPNSRFARYGQNWSQHLPSETTVYLQKLRTLRRLQQKF